LGKLTALTIRNLKFPPNVSRPIRFGDGDGLYLQIAPGNTKSWVFRFTQNGKPRELGLGPFGEAPDRVPLTQARILAGEARARVKQGFDPIADKKKARSENARAAAAATEQTFRNAALALVESKKAGWRSAKHGDQWLATLKAYVFPFIGDMPVAVIGTDDVLRVLRPIWGKIPETASRVRQRIEAVLDDARVRGWRPENLANPARWKGHLSATLPPPRQVHAVEHYPSLPWEQTGAFMVALSEREGIAALALRFTILTASRTGAVRKMLWQEVDMTTRVWTTPATNMKGKKLHRVPLSDATIQVLNEVKALATKPEDLVFPSPRTRRPTSDMALSMLVRGMSCDGLAAGAAPRWRDVDGRPVVPHGFRATFKGWSLAAGYPDPLSELALAHTDKDKVRAAYAREDMLEQRRPMMDAWAKHCLKR